MPNNIDKEKNEVAVYSDKPLDFPEKIKDLDGNEVVIKKLSLKQEIELYTVFSDFLAQLVKKSEGSEEVATIENLNILKEVPLFYLKAAVPILNLSEEEIKERFDLQTLKGLVDPFFAKFLNDKNPIAPMTGVLQNSLPSTPTTADGQ